MPCLVEGGSTCQRAVGRYKWLRSSHALAASVGLGSVERAQRAHPNPRSPSKHTYTTGPHTSGPGPLPACLWPGRPTTHAQASQPAPAGGSPKAAPPTRSDAVLPKKIIAGDLISEHHGIQSYNRPACSRCTRGSQQEQAASVGRQVMHRQPAHMHSRRLPGCTGKSGGTATTSTSAQHTRTAKLLPRATESHPPRTCPRSWRSVRSHVAGTPLLAQRVQPRSGDRGSGNAQRLGRQLLPSRVRAVGCWPAWLLLPLL